MARVNVDSQALTDARFTVLGSHLSPLTRAPQETVETAFGLFMMLRVWNYCLERGLLIVPARDLDAIHPGLADAMIDAELGELVAPKRARLVRIKGGEGRLDWLKKAREAGRENGVKGAASGIKGGRPPKKPKPPEGVSEKGDGGFLNNPLLTLPLAPALPLSPEEEKPREEKDIAASPPAADSNSGEYFPADSPPPPAPKPRPRDPLWDAIVAITGADASIKTIASHIGRIRKVLSEAKPPYSAADVLALPAAAAQHLPWTAGRVLTLGEIEKNIGLVRQSGQPIHSSGHRGKPTSLTERQAPALQTFMARGSSGDS